MHRSILWLHLYRLVRNSAIVAAMNCCSTSRALVHFFFDFCISILMQHFPFYTFGALLLCIPNQPISIERYALFGNSPDETGQHSIVCRRVQRRSIRTKVKLPQNPGQNDGQTNEISIVEMKCGSFLAPISLGTKNRSFKNPGQNRPRSNEKWVPRGLSVLLGAGRLCCDARTADRASFLNTRE